MYTVTIMHINPAGSGEWAIKINEAGASSVQPSEGLAIARAWELVKELPEDEAEVLVVETAHDVGLSVEGELGTIGKLDEEAEEGGEIIYTVPSEAVEFVKQTGVDSLAIAIGTSHGLYPKDLDPKLRIDLLKEIKALLPIPLVLHGGSNNPDSEIAEAVKYGINKINISSDIKAAYHDAMRKELENKSLREPNTIQPPAIAAMKKVAAQKIDLFEAAGKAALY